MISDNLKELYAGTDGLVSHAALIHRLRTLQHDHLTDVGVACHTAVDVGKMVFEDMERLPAERRARYMRLLADAAFQAAQEVGVLVLWELEQGILPENALAT